MLALLLPYVNIQFIFWYMISQDISSLISVSPCPGSIAPAHNAAELSFHTNHFNTPCCLGAKPKEISCLGHSAPTRSRVDNRILKSSMATACEPGSPSRLRSDKFTSITKAPSDTAMHDLPVELSTAQMEAKQILLHLLERLKDHDSKYYKRYGKWAEYHPHLDDICFRFVRPQIWTFLNGRWSLDALKAVGGDLKTESRGIYFNAVLGIDKKVRLYIGQANTIRPRVAQHLNFRYRRDNPSLHYHALQQSIYNQFGIAVILPSPNMGNHALPGMDRPDLMLNLLELWMCLVFRTLPPQILKEWLPDDETISKHPHEGKEGIFQGLNIALPLNHGEKTRDWLDMSTTEDPLVRDYLGVGRKIQPTESRDDVAMGTRKQEDKVTTAEVEDTPAVRRKAYTEHAKSYNKHMNMREAESSQALGLMFALGIGIAIGAALFRTAGGRGVR